MKTPKMVCVDWIDSASDHGWHASEDAYPNVAKCQTVGFLVDENKERIVIAQSRAVDNVHYPWGEFISIPRVAITKRRLCK